MLGTTGSAGPNTSDLSIKAWRVLSATDGNSCLPDNFIACRGPGNPPQARESGFKTKMLTDEGEHFV
jgi:hypothetical protein